MGGVVAMRLALSRPEAVASLLLMDTAPAPAGGEEVLVQLGEVALREGMATLGALLAGVQEKPDDPAHDPRGRQAAAFVRMDPAAFAAFADELGRYPSLAGRLAEIHCPVTVLVGEHDALLRAGADQLAQAIAGARLEVVPDGGHSPQTSARQAWLAAVRRHFDNLPQPPPPVQG
jgi:pimeloyl-ACP methyl ester carboxylesterase